MARVMLAAGFALLLGALGALVAAGWHLALGGSANDFELLSASSNGDGLWVLFQGAAGGLVIGAVLGWFLPDYRHRPRLVGLVFLCAVAAAVPFIVAAGYFDDYTDYGGASGIGPVLAILTVPASVVVVLALRRRLETRP